jgi:hypothetical protein
MGNDIFSSCLFRARKLKPTERGNTYFAYDLEALVVCEAVKHWCYLEGCSKFFVETDHGTLRHMLMQPNNMLNKRQARYQRDLQSFVGSMILACRKGALNEDDPLCRRPNFVLHAKFHYFGMARFRQIANYDGSPNCC